jgi:antitoxin (DNA-binding transcriptional repressor) of toxin-antitoxin stability system
MKATSVHAPVWQLQEAKNRLSEVVHAAETIGPQTITRHGKAVVIMTPVVPKHSTDGMSAWDLLGDEQVGKVGGPPELARRTVDPEAEVPLPW